MHNKLRLPLIFLFLACVSVEQAVAESAVTVKLMCWNLLNYPSTSAASADTTLRHPFYRTVIQYENPDILVTEENTFFNGTTWFLNNVMNTSGTVYSKGTFINGPDTNNEIYFKSSDFIFISNRAIETDVRDINEFTLKHILTGDTIRIYAVHLKASSGNPNDAQRALEVDSLRKVTNALPASSNFVVCGDFNFYGNFEPGYQKLLLNNTTDDGNFIDPIVMTGTWNYYPYRFYHTQSTRTASFGGGATGGMNDRFDMILFSTAISQGISGVTYVPGSTTPIGNDGNHFNSAINIMPNTAAPSTVIDALYNASDHLPVYVLLNFTSVTGIQTMEENPLQLSLFPNPSHDQTMLSFTLKEPSSVSIKILDVLGKEISVFSDEHVLPGNHTISLTSVKNLEPGIYFINFQSGTSCSVLKFNRN
jgi:hypothetical protein